MEAHFKRLVPRDIEIFQLLLKYRFLTRDQLCDFYGLKRGGSQKLPKRLLALAEQGFIDYLPGLAIPAFALSDGGAAYLQDYEGLMPAKETWATKNKRLKASAYGPHDQALNSFMLSWQKAVTEVGEGALLSDADLRQALSLGVKPKAFKWGVDISWQGRAFSDVAVIPDQVTALVQESGKAAYFFVELDTGTEQQSLKRGKYLTSPTIMKKFLAYSETHASGAVEIAYGFENFRVLFVVAAGEKRLQGMLNLFQEHADELAPPNVFLFATLDDLSVRGVMAEGVWRNGRGEGVSLS